MAASVTSSSASESEGQRRSRRDGRSSRDRPRSGFADSRVPPGDERKHRDDRRSSSGNEVSDSDDRGKRRRSTGDRRHAKDGEKARNRRSDQRGRGRDEDGEDGRDDRVRKRDRKRSSDEEESPRRRERARDERRLRYRDDDSPRQREKKRERDRDRRKQHLDDDRSPRSRERAIDNGRDRYHHDDDSRSRHRRHRDRDRNMEEGHPKEEDKKVQNELPPPPPLPPPMPDSNAGRTGGIYIPPFRMAQMMREVQDKSSEAYQRLSWDALRKSINGLVNKVNATNIKNIIPELFSENLIRGRGLFCRSCMKSQMASPGFTDVFAALVAVVNTKFPEVGLLLLKRIVLQLKRAYKRNDKPQLLAATKFIAHLVNQQVGHEIIALELLTVLLENPTDDSVEVAVGFVKECGALLQDFSPQGLHVKCLNGGRCIIYMPRIDLWAINETLGAEAKQSEGSKPCKSSEAAGVVSTNCPSQEWNSFVEQVDSVCASGSINILATCEMQHHDLPLAIRHFFSSDALNHADSGPSEHTAPRFLMCVDGNFNPDLVIDSCAAKLSEDLVQHYVQLVHERTHINNSHHKSGDFHAVKANAELPRLNVEIGQTTAITDALSERIASNSGASCRDDKIQRGTNGDQRWSPSSKMRGHGEVDLQLHRHEGSIPGIFPSKAMKGSSVLAITTFGYQILRYPQFAELCWVTSKLKEGPSADINGPWKGWPFNSCLMDLNSSPNKVVAGVNSSNLKSQENSGVVRGLVAVGLLAYKGVYTSVREVSLEVRKVLELLVGQVRAKILGRKDKYRYLRLLSQVAYLEDIVNSWAYALQRVQTDNQISMSSTKPVVSERLHVDNNLKSSDLFGDPTDVPTIQNEEVSGSPHKLVTSNGENVNFNKGASPHSDINIIPVVEHFQEPDHSLFLSGSTSAGTTPFNGDGTCGSESPTPSQRLENMKGVDGLGVTENSLPSEANICNPDNSVAVTRSCLEQDKCNGLDNNHSSNNVWCFTDELGTVSEFTHTKNNELSVVSGTACLYCCCSSCLRAVSVLVRSILYDYWRSKSHCSTIDDIHDLLVSISLHLLAVVRKSYASQSSTDSEECFERKQNQRVQLKYCACQDIVDKQLEKMPCQHKTLKGIQFMPKECSCHSRNEDSETANGESISLCESDLSFFFRDGVLMPSCPHKDAVLHCRYEKLCVCSMLEMIFMTKKPLG